MARNRRSQSAAIRFGPVLKVVLLCSLFCGVALGYVWQKEQIARLGDQMKKSEIHLRELVIQNEKLERQLADLRRPAWLEARIKELGLGLDRPQQAQIWTLREPVRELPAPPVEVERQYAAAGRNGSNTP
jgi:hypothetical protein